MSKSTKSSLPVHLQASIESRKKDKEKKDKLILDCLKKFYGLTLNEIETYFQNRNNNDTKIPSDIAKRTFLLNSLNRLAEEEKIYSHTAKDPVHGKIVRKYYHNNGNNDSTIIRINLDDPMLENISENPCAYIKNSDQIIIAKKGADSVVTNLPTNQQMFWEVKKIDSKSLQLPEQIIDFYSLDTGKYYFEKEIDKNKITLTRIRSLESETPKPRKKIKNILVLEDSQRYTKQIKRRFKETQHKITYTKTYDNFLKVLEKYGKTFDVISMDNKINDVEIAEKLSSKVRYHSPNALVGLISNTVDRDILKTFQDFGYNFIIKKRVTDDTDDTDDSMTMDEFISWLEVV